MLTAKDDLLQRRSVQLGRTIGDDVEVLSGLSEGEKVAVLAGTTTQRKGV